MNNVIKKKALKQKGSSTFLTAENDVIVFHKMAKGQRKLSGMLSDGTKVNSPVITCHKKKGIIKITAHTGSLTTKDLALANKAIDMLSGHLSADFVR